MEALCEHEMYKVVILGFLIASGCSGNILAILMWGFGNKSKRIFCSKFFLVIAFLDLYIIIAEVGREFAAYMRGFILFDVSEFWCTYVNFTSFYVWNVAAWLRVSVIIELTLAVACPNKCCIKNDRWKALSASIVVFFLFIPLNMHRLMGIHYETYEDIGSCIWDLKDEDQFTYKVMSMLTNFVVSPCLSMFVILTCSSYLLLKVGTSTSKQRLQLDGKYLPVKYVLGVGLVYILFSIISLAVEILMYDEQYTKAHLAFCYTYRDFGIHALTPWMYVIVESEFRADVWRMCSSCTCCRVPDTDTQNELASVDRTGDEQQIEQI